MLWELQRKRFEENRGNRKLCHLNPFEFFDHTSNLYDRFQRGAVIDFLDIRVWPVFNITDVAISAGVGIALWLIR